MLRKPRYHNLRTAWHGLLGAVFIQSTPPGRKPPRSLQPALLAQIGRLPRDQQPKSELAYMHPASQSIVGRAGRNGTRLVSFSQGSLCSAASFAKGASTDPLDLILFTILVGKFCNNRAERKEANFALSLPLPRLPLALGL